MREPVRILAFYLMSYRGKIISGVERRFLEISSRLMALGAEIFTLEYKPSLLETWGYSSYRPIKLSRRFRSHDVLEAIRLIIHGLKACIKFKCDVVYVPGGFPYAGLRVIVPPYVTSLLCRKPLVIVIHDLRERAYHYSERAIVRMIRLLTHQRAKACITVSQATANDIRNNFKVRNLVVTGNGVNRGIFRNIKGQTKLYDAIYFGRISEEKGIYTLLEAWKIIIKKLPSAKLLLAGGTEENTGDTYRKIVERLGRSRNVTLAGLVSDQQAVSMLNSSRIFVLPSTEEGFGLTVLEAMATGLPCILSDLPALRENFVSAAVFVNPKDVQGLAQAILGLLSDPEKCRRLKEKGKRLANRYSWDVVAKKELEVFKSIIKH